MTDTESLLRLLSTRVRTWSPWTSWAPIPIRLIVGYGFMEHGIAKAERGLDAFPAILAALGVPAPHVMGLLTIAVEILGGAAVLGGAFVPLASIPMAVVLFTAMATVHWQYGFSSIKLQAIAPDGAKFGPPGIETDLLYLAGLVTLVLGGAGPFSVDRTILRYADRVAAGERALVLGRSKKPA